jgi:FkbM family methyltransferase
MALPNVNYYPRLLPKLVEAGAFSEAPFTLVDIGCSMGIELQWRSFGSQLRAIGVDPLIEECARLQREESNPAVKYLPAWIRQPGFPDDVNRKSDNFKDRVSAWAAIEILSAAQPAPRPPAARSGRYLTLDELVSEAAFDYVDFIKVDVDGPDLEVLASGPETLGARGVLGIEIETHYVGGRHEWANTAANVFRFLHDQGFTLFDFDMHRYSRRALPDMFFYAMPTSTRRGQPRWGNLLFLRDAGAEDYEANWPSLDAIAVIKLAALLEIHGLNDCAVELILKHRDTFDRVFPSQRALDLLATGWWPDAAGYAELMERFRADPGSFYPPSPFRPNEDGTPSEEEKKAQDVFRDLYYKPQG